MIGQRLMKAKRIAWKRWNGYPHNGGDYKCVGFFRKSKECPIGKAIEPDWEIETGNEIQMLCRKKARRMRLHGWRKRKYIFLRDELKNL